MTLRNNGLLGSAASTQNPTPTTTTPSTAPSPSSSQDPVLYHQYQPSSGAQLPYVMNNVISNTTNPMAPSATQQSNNNNINLIMKQSQSSSLPAPNSSTDSNNLISSSVSSSSPSYPSSSSTAQSGQQGPSSSSAASNSGQFIFMGNNFSNENYDSTGASGDAIGPRMPTIHHPHYQNHNPKQYRNSQQASSPSAKNNNVDHVIYEEINENSPHLAHHLKSATSGQHAPLGDLTNLTDEERYKLDEIRTKRDTLKAEIQKLREEISNVKKELSRMDSLSTGDLSASMLTSGANSATNLKTDVEGMKAKKLQIGKKKFNMDPKKGIEFLVENSILEHTPGSVAQFLYKGEGLTKMSIGTYLGEKIDFNLQVLDAFVELHNFRNLHLVKALRQFLYSFRLPGEAQKIDRIMEKFAGHYCQHNDGVFNSSDTCYVLCFSVIMLNTTLHNPNVKTKMTAEQFVAMNRGINNGDDLPQSLLLDLYESIRNEPFKMPEDDGFTFFNPDREGWLWKQGGRYKNWKRRWFLLSDKCLYYFENTNDKEPRGIIPLENIGVRDISERSSRQHCMELFSTNQSNNVIKACKTDAEGRVIEGRHTVYRLSAGTEQEKDAWLQSLKASVSKSPFYEMLAARKRKAQHN